MRTPRQGQTAIMGWGSNDKGMRARLEAALQPGEDIVWAERKKFLLRLMSKDEEVIAYLLGAIVIGLWFLLMMQMLLSTHWNWTNFLCFSAATLVLSFYVYQAYTGGRVGTSERFVFLTNRRFGVLARLPALATGGVLAGSVDKVARVEARMGQSGLGTVVVAGMWSDPSAVFDVENAESLARRIAALAGIEPTIRNASDSGTEQKVGCA